MTGIRNSVLNKKTRLIALEIAMLILACIMLMPIYYLLTTTFKTMAEATAHPLGLPKNFTLENYIKAWDAMNYPRVFKNNFLMTFFSVAGIVLITSMAAYSIARREHKLNRIIYYIFLSGMMIPFQTAIIPLYRLVSSLGLMNKIYGIIIILIFINVPFSLFLFKGFIKTIPYELEESAFIDGCSVLRTYWQITLPLMRPVIATVVILDTLAIWNDFLTPMLFLQTRENGVILLEIYRNLGPFSTDWTSFFPMMVLGVAPLLIFYLFMQKNIIKGITAGSLKG